MARRSSARLRNRNSSTPKRVSLSHDAHPATPRTAPVRLTALKESDEMPGAFPSSASPPMRLTSNAGQQHSMRVPVNFNGATPTQNTPTKPAEEEMHPKQHQQSTAKPLEEARWLGFSNMYPQTEPPKQSSRLANLQATPTKASSGVQSPKINFAFNREQSLELSPAAKKIMEETREEAARIREQMIASGEGAQDNQDMASRKIATPKSRKGRFSDAHKAQFSKMDSIASHRSVRRVEAPLNISVSTPGQKGSQRNVFETSPTKSLKRKQSKVDLDEPDRYQAHPTATSTSKPAAMAVATHLPRPTFTDKVTSAAKPDPGSPAKRAKHSGPSETSKIRLQPSTPQPAKTTPRQPHYPDLSSLASPTQASLARTTSVKAVTSKIPGPTLVRSPSKPTFQQQNVDSLKASTPLLARSPSKASLFEHAAREIPKTAASQLLLRSPTKSSIWKKSPDEGADNKESKANETPLLARSPLKVSVVKRVEPSVDDRMQATSSTTPLLQRSPAKMSIVAPANEDGTSGTPNKGTDKGLMGRFQLLRSSPMKSILRSPQRLYSDDPAKVAAGTHLATPPKFVPEKGMAAAASAQKRVDFSSSTKARYERAQSELSSTPSKGPTPSPVHRIEDSKPAQPVLATYPTLPSSDNGVIVTPQERRQTAVPGDFTFKAEQHSIFFRQSPNAPASAASIKRTSTIRHVSAEPELLAQVTGSKKRKFEYENAIVGSEDESDKENEESDRPSKRMKRSVSESPAAKPSAKPTITKRPTLGVKPKKGDKDAKDKKPSVISRARLAALSQPKRRA